MRLEELFHCVCVPFCDAQRLDYMSVLVEQLYLWIETAQVLNLKIFEFAGSFRLHERLDLRISAELAGANFQNRFWVLFGPGASGFLLATFDALLLDLLKAKVFEIVAR